MKRYCLALDLKDDDALIAEYEKWHKQIWPAVVQSIASSGIQNMEIYRVSNRMFMIMEVSDSFSLQKKSESDLANPVIQEWEKLMWNYQQALPFAKPGEKWVVMEKIFSLT